MKDKRRFAVILLALLFIIVVIKDEFASSKEKNKDERGMVDKQEAQELQKTDYGLESFRLIFESEELESILDDRKDYLKYTLYDFLYKNDLKDASEGVVMKDFEDTDSYTRFLIKIKAGEDIYFNTIYMKSRDSFTYEVIEHQEPGITNSYEEIE